jgi:ABC-type branched-subunit amino acid transport system substrate-binding protein
MTRFNRHSSLSSSAASQDQCYRHPDHSDQRYSRQRLAVQWLRLLLCLIVLSFIVLSGCTPTPISFSQVNKPLRRLLKDPFRSQTVSNPSQSRPAQFKLGLLLSLSGSLAKYGTTMQDSASLLTETVNSCNGVAGQAVQLFLEDDQSSASAGKAAMARLAANQVEAVVGAIGSEISNASVDVAVTNQIVQISPASANEILTKRAQKGDFKGYWFRTMPPDPSQGEALAQLALRQGFKTVTVLTIDNDYGNSIARVFESTYEQLGKQSDKQTGKQSGGQTSVSVESVVRYSPYASIYDVDLYSAFSAQPDAVLVVAEPNLGSALLKAAYDSGAWSGNTKVLLPSSMKINDLAERVGQSTGGRYNASSVIGVTPVEDSSARKQFRERYKEAYDDREPALYDPYTWDAAAVAVLAAEAANTGGATLRSKMFEVANAPGIVVSDVCQALTMVREGRDINYQGASGTVDFNQAGDAIGIYNIWTIDFAGTIKVESPVSPILAGQDKNLSAN